MASFVSVLTFSEKLSFNICKFKLSHLVHLQQLQQEGQIANMENRNYYSLHCLQMETQLVYAHLDIFYSILSCMMEVEAQANAQVRVKIFFVMSLKGYELFVHILNTLAGCYMQNILLPLFIYIITAWITSIFCWLFSLSIFF